MSAELAIAVATGCGAMTGWGAADFFAKRTVDRIGDLTTLFWGQLSGTVALLTIFAIGRHTHGLSAGDIGPMIGFGVVSGLSYLLLYRGFARGQVSLLSPLFASYAGGALLISAVFFDEVIPGTRWLGLALIIVGILSMTGDPADLRRSWSSERRAGGVPEVLGAMIVFSTWLVLWDQFVDGRSWVICLALMRIVACLTLLVTARIQRVSLHIPERDLWPTVVLIGLCDVAAFALVSLGFSATSYVSVVAVLSAGFSLPTLLLARLFLDERLTPLQLGGAGTLLAGIAIVTI